MVADVPLRGPGFARERLQQNYFFACWVVVEDEAGYWSGLGKIKSGRVFVVVGRSGTRMDWRVVDRG